MATAELTRDYQQIFSYHQVTTTAVRMSSPKNKITSWIAMKSDLNR
jgi:hypothetical protein